jgi:6-phosphogluconolactonase
MTTVARSRLSFLILLALMTVTTSGVVVVFVGNAITAAYAATPASPGVARMGNKMSLYAALGNVLTDYDVDIGKATLTARSSVTLPGNVQEAHASPSRKFLYVAWSDGGSSYTLPNDSKIPAATKSGVTAFRIDSNTGALQPVGEPATLPGRPIDVTVDASGTHLLVAFPQPSGLLVFRLGADGSIGEQVKQLAPLNVGIYAHQIRVDPANQIAILVTRGNAPTSARSEDPGAIEIFAYNDGMLTNRESIAPSGGFNFQSRHLDFHPTGPWIYLTLERQNKLTVWKKQGDGTLNPQPIFVKDTLSDASHLPPAQAAATIHVHPSGHFVYVANRAFGTEMFQGRRISAAGENSIAVFSIDLQTGEPTLIQTIDTRGISPRTFSIDPTGRILVAANQYTLGVRDGEGVKSVQSCLSVFRIGSDGKLAFVRKYDAPATDSKSLFWVGILALPTPN